ncbi:MAG: cysteine desulfurase family protein [Pseudomonadota bacterium]
MTGLDGKRVYLDWNATAPLRPEARAAMLAAMDQVGNPSSVHAEGRAAKKIIEKARGQVAALVGCDASELVFTSGATEAAATPLYEQIRVCFSGSCLEHDAVLARIGTFDWSVGESGAVQRFKDDAPYAFQAWEDELALTLANGEIGTLQPVAEIVEDYQEAARTPIVLCDVTQAAAKVEFKLSQLNVDFACLSAHKFGGPKGVGALYARSGSELGEPLAAGGGQEKGRRSGTENVIGIAGFGAAAEAAQRDLETGVWHQVEKLRNILENTLAEAVPETIFFGQESPRLPNTSCFAVPGWKGETQVMQMDLAGFAISAGSACSSGKVNKASRVLLAMGFDEVTASSAIRVSMGPTTTEAEVMAFAQTWIDHYNRRKSRAA